MAELPGDIYLVSGMLFATWIIDKKIRISCGSWISSLSFEWLYL